MSAVLIGSVGLADAGRRVGDQGVRAGCGGVVEAIDEVGDGARRPGAVVLDLHEADDVGIERDDGVDDLGPLALELEGRVGAALRREATAEAVAVEVVQDVEARDLEPAADLFGRGGPVVDAFERHRAPWVGSDSRGSRCWS